MFADRAARLGMLILLSAMLSPGSANAAEACMGRNCLPAQDDPFTECIGRQCAEPAPPADGPEIECTGEDCFPTADPPAEDCTGEDCFPKAAPPAEYCKGEDCTLEPDDDGQQ